MSRLDCGLLFTRTVLDSQPDRVRFPAVPTICVEKVPLLCNPASGDTGCTRISGLGKALRIRQKDVIPPNLCEILQND
jgi:hypothetical protein